MSADPKPDDYESVYETRPREYCDHPNTLPAGRSSPERMCTDSDISVFTSPCGEALSSSEMFGILQNRAQVCLSGLGPACDKIGEGFEEWGREGGPVLF